MNARIALLAFPLIALAQAPPPEVDQALRARATQFFQYYVDGEFRKAYDMVAEDTKDQYFNGNKQRIKAFHIEEITYSDNFTKAAVKVKATREMFLLGESIPTEFLDLMTFKIENGKWVWYWVNEGYIVTPVSVSKVDPTPPGTNPAGPAVPATTLPGLGVDLSPEGVKAVAMKLLAQSGFDKSEVILAPSKASETKVVFHNGMTGAVQVRLAQFGDVPGFTASLDKTQLEGSENSSLILRYVPGDQKPPDMPIELRVVVSPTAQAYTVMVKFSPAGNQ